MQNVSRLRLSALFVMAALSGCLGPVDPIPVRPLEFGGTVRNAQTGAPVPGAQVQIWLLIPEQMQAATPAFVEGSTDAAGSFAFRREVRNRAIPPGMTLRVTPPASAGVAAQMVGGLFSDVFPVNSRVGEHGWRYTADVRLAPAP